MKKNRTWIAALLLISIFGALLTGCQNSTNQADSSAGVSASAPSGADTVPSDLETSSAADAWPEKPIQVLVPAAAGGGMSITASYFFNEFTARTGQTPIMTNNAGLPGYNASMDLEADGYNFFLGNSTILTYKALGTLDFGYEAYDAVGILGIAPAFGIFVMADSPYQTLDDLVEAMKADPGGIVIGNKAGTFKHLYSALMLDVLECEANLVEFGDDAPCVAALLGGNADVYVGSYSGAITQYYDSGEVICLAVADTQRVEATPDVPTFQECGYDFTFPYQMTTLVAPKGTDPAILDKLNQMIIDVANTDQYKADMQALGSLPCPWTREECTAYFEECQVLIDEAATLLEVTT